jgi:hypothetical protein
VERRLWRVFVDESGDRTLNERSKPYFTLAAVLVRADREGAVLAQRDQWCDRLNKPRTTVLHWSENLKKHDQRKYVSQSLGRLNLRVQYVIVDKASLREQGSALEDHAMLYNYAVRRLLERVSWYVDGQRGEAIVTFAHVKRFPYDRLQSYLTHLRSQRTTIAWDALRGNVRIASQGELRMLQVADVAAGCLSSALVRDAFGNVEDAYLRNVSGVIIGRQPADIRSYGLNVVGEPACLERYDWWPWASLL